jgi:hypothetical protein
MSAGFASITVFSSSSASGEKRGLLLAAIFVVLDEVEGSACRSEVAEGLRLGVHGTARGTETAVLGDDDATSDGGGGEDDRKISVAAAMIGAAELLAPTFLSPNDERRGCISADEGRTVTDWVGEDGGGCSTAACPRDLRRFALFRSSALACSRAFSASLRACASAEMRGLVAVVVRAHSGTTYGFLTTAGAGAGSGAGTDVAALEIGLAGTAWAVFGGEGKAAATRALRAANKSAFCRGVCTGTGLLG